MIRGITRAPRSESWSSLLQSERGLDILMRCTPIWQISTLVLLCAGHDHNNVSSRQERVTGPTEHQLRCRAEGSLLVFIPDCMSDPLTKTSTRSSETVAHDVMDRLLIGRT